MIVKHVQSRQNTFLTKKNHIFVAEMQGFNTKFYECFQTKIWPIYHSNVLKLSHLKYLLDQYAAAELFFNVNFVV